MFASRINQIETELQEVNVADDVRANIKEKLGDALGHEKRQNAQLVLDKYQAVQESVKNSCKLHEQFTGPDQIIGLSI